MPRTLIVFPERGKTFRIVVPDEAKLTFGPFSPPTSESKGYRDPSALKGTLRVYENRTSGANIIGVFTGVTGYRDTSLIEYEEEVVQEIGSTVWRSDKGGYKVEESVQRSSSWTDPVRELSPGSADEFDPDK